MPAPAVLTVGSSIALAQGALVVTYPTSLTRHEERLFIRVDTDVVCEVVPDEGRSSVSVTETLNPSAVIDEVRARQSVTVAERLNLLATVTEVLLSLTIHSPVTTTLVLTVDERPYLVDVDEVD